MVAPRERALALSLSLSVAKPPEIRFITKRVGRANIQLNMFRRVYHRGRIPENLVFQLRPAVGRGQNLGERLKAAREFPSERSGERRRTRET